MTRPLLAALVLTAACTTPAAAAEIRDLGFHPSGYKAGAGYDLRVSFGSVCCGPDRGAVARVAALIRGSGLPAEAVRWSWGREGETDFGLRFRSGEDRRAFACRLVRLRAETSAAGSGAGGPRPAFAILPDEAEGQIKSCSQATRGASAGGMG